MEHENIETVADLLEWCRANDISVDIYYNANLHAYRFTFRRWIPDKDMYSFSRVIPERDLFSVRTPMLQQTINDVLEEAEHKLSDERLYSEE